MRSSGCCRGSKNFRTDKHLTELEPYNLANIYVQRTT